MSVAFLDGGEILRGCLLVIQNDIGLRNPPEGVDAEIRARLSQLISYNFMGPGFGGQRVAKTQIWESVFLLEV